MPGGIDDLVISQGFAPESPSTQLFVPPDIAGGRAYRNHVGATVTVDVRNYYAGGSHAVVQHLPLPRAAVSVDRVIDVKARTRTTVTGHDLIIAVEIGTSEGMAVPETRIDHLPIPQLARAVARSGD